MQIIWDKTVAEKLSSTHTVLELETFQVDDQPVTTYCVVSVDSIPLVEFAELETNKTLHKDFVLAFKRNDYDSCCDISAQLMGKFGGEVDSFYTIILEKLQK
jgi:hypothetical protein